jgi:hypothetical protein
MKLPASSLLLIASWMLVAGNVAGKTLNILLLANASTQDIIQKLIQEYHQQNALIRRRRKICE